MKYFFIAGEDIGYLDMGLFQSKYTALLFVIQMCRRLRNGKQYKLVDANAKVLATVTSGANPQHKWHRKEKKL